LLLGLLANTHVLGAIWSIALGEHIGHKAGAPDTALRNWRGDLPRPPGVLGQDSSAGAGFWTMGYGCSVRYGQIRPGAPVSTWRLCSDQPRMARGRGILRGSCGRRATPALFAY